MSADAKKPAPGRETGFANENQMTVPLLDLRAQYFSLKGEIDAAISGVLARMSFVHAEEVALFEREFARFCEAREAIGVASGSEALRLALLACGIGPGDEVITTPLTFIATVEAICHVGAKPVFVDVDPKAWNIDTARIEGATTERTKAVVPVHLYGNPADMDGIRDIAARHGLRVIEDAAQAHGARYKGQRVGAIGDVGCFSFCPSTNLGAFGEAGMVVTNDPEIAEQIRLLRDHGRIDRYEHVCVGFNCRMDAIQAAVLRIKLRRLDTWNARRRAIASAYRVLLRGKGLELPPESRFVEPVYHRFVIRSSRRGHIRRVLTSAGIETGIHFPIPVHLQPAYRHLGCRTGDFPASERAAREILSLPIFPELTDGQVHEVARCFSQAASVSLDVWAEAATGS